VVREANCKIDLISKCQLFIKFVIIAIHYVLVSELTLAFTY